MKSLFLPCLLLILLVAETAVAQSVQPPGVEIPKERRLGTVPDYFMLTMNDPGCDPEEDCDDVGPKKVYRNWYLEQTLCNLGGLHLSWPDCEKEDPGGGEPVYDFSGVKMSAQDQRMKYKIAGIGSGGTKWISDPSQGIGPPWVEKEEFKFEVRDGKKVVSDRYWKRLEDFAEAACRFAREKYGVTIFTTGGNERDLAARDSYQDFYPDWHFYYMAPIVHIHAGMKRAHPENQLMIGNLCYTDGPHVEALYQAGAKGNFEILAIHNYQSHEYGPGAVHLDMYQIIEGHNALARHGDGDIGLFLGEGWSCFPLPERIDKDPANRQPGGRVYTPEDCEHYRQTVLDGWRNLMTPRKDEYEPRWVIGASYFVLNDHWGGRGWEQRAIAVYEENGQRREIPAVEYHGQGRIKAFKLDGYDIGTGDPLWIKPFLRPWGLIDINGRPKGDIVFNFPPYLPKHDFEAVIDAPTPDKTVVAGYEYPVTVKFTNREKSPMTDFRLEMIGRDDAAKKVRYRSVGGDEATMIAPGQTITRRFTVTYPASLVQEDAYRVRGFTDAHYTWEGRPYHTDAWMPKVRVTAPFSLSLGEGKRTALNPAEEVFFAVILGSSHRAKLKIPVRVHEPPPEVLVRPEKAVLETQAPGAIQAAFVATLRDPAKTGMYTLRFRSLDGIEELAVPIAFSPGAREEPRGFGLRNPSFEDFDADSGYAFWEGEKTNWMENEEAKSLPAAGSRAFGAATDWLTFDYVLGQSVDLPEGAAGKKVRATVWFLGRGWDADASGKDVEGYLNLILLDESGKALARKDGPKELGTGSWREIALVSDPIPEKARRARLELRLVSHRDRGCRRGAMDMARLELVP